MKITAFHRPRRLACVAAGALVVANATLYAAAEEASPSAVLAVAGGAVLVAIGLRRS